LTDGSTEQIKVRGVLTNIEFYKPKTYIFNLLNPKDYVVISVC